MKVTQKWLNEYVSCNDIDSKEIEKVFTLSGTKVEGITKTYNMKNVVIGKVEEITSHPDATKLVVCQVNVKNKVIQIVTGAPNLKVGDIVPVALDNSVLPNGMEIKKGQLRGVESNGMMCSYQELNLPSDFQGNQVEYGIMVLPKKYEENLGDDFLKVFDINDNVFEFEITPNRQDCQGVKGIARELAVGLNREFIDNTVTKFDNLNKVNKLSDLAINIEDEDVLRYIALEISDVKITNSPEEIANKLRLSGINPINNIVDITNYVMLEIGQPIHAFDKEKIEGDITVRNSKENEEFITLDGSKIILNNDLVISDNNKALALAGIIGGENSGISENTKNIVIEVANFTRKRLRNTSRRENLLTSAYSKFEKKLPLKLAELAVERIIDLITKYEYGTVNYEVFDYINLEEQKLQENKYILLDSKKINKQLGLEIDKGYMKNLFRKLEFSIKEENNEIFVKAPDFRTDVKRVEDLTEEVIRFYGFDKLNSTLPQVDIINKKENKKLTLKQKAKNMLVNFGYNQILTYGFVSKKELELSNSSKDILGNDAIEVINELGEDYKVMRTSLIPSILKTISNNEKKQNFNLKLFEISKIYTNSNNIQNDELPVEEEILILANTYSKTKESISSLNYTNLPIFKLKEDVLKVIGILGINQIQIEQVNTNNKYHIGKCAELKKGRDVIGTFGQINPKLVNNFDIKEDVYVLELNMDKVVKYSKNNFKYTEVSKFQEVKRDISMYINENIKYSDIENVILKTNKKLIKNVTLFDIYENSIGVQLTIKDDKKTLEDFEINEVVSKVIDNLVKELNVEIRN